jgi:hypothetical protein
MDGFKINFIHKYLKKIRKAKLEREVLFRRK